MDFPASGAASSSPVRNWLDTFPRTADLAGFCQPRRRNLNGGKPALSEIFDLRTELAQGIDQIANRPLVHARHATQL